MRWATRTPWSVCIATALGFWLWAAAEFRYGDRGMAGLNLLIVAASLGALTRRLWPSHDGTRLHGLVSTLLGAIALLGAVMVLQNRAEFMDSQRGAGVVFFVAPIAGVVGLAAVALGLRLLALPRPHILRDRRRSRPNRGIRATPVPMDPTDGTPAGWQFRRLRLYLEDAAWVLPRGYVASGTRVGPESAQLVVVRFHLTKTLRDLGAPWWLRLHLVEEDAVEFAVPARDAAHMPDGSSAEG